MRKYLAALAVVAATTATAAQAQPTTKNFSIDFLFDASAPIQHITGDFSVTFDSPVVTPGTSAGLTISNFNFPYEGEAKFALGTLSDGGVMYTLGNNVALNFCQLDVSIRSFCTAILGDTEGSFQQVFFIYTYDGQVYENIASTDPNPPTGVPEPAAWAMMIGGLGLAGAGLRVRRTSVALAA